MVTQHQCPSIQYMLTMGNLGNISHIHFTIHHNFQLQKLGFYLIAWQWLIKSLNHPTENSQYIMPIHGRSEEIKLDVPLLQTSVCIIVHCCGWMIEWSHTPHLTAAKKDNLALIDGPCDYRSTQWCWLMCFFSSYWLTTLGKTAQTTLIMSHYSIFIAEFSLIFSFHICKLRS